MLALVLALLAGIQDIEELDLEALLVTTGSRVSTKLTESPSSVWVIDRRAIETSGATSIGDLLRQVPGVMVHEATSGHVEVVIRQTAEVPVNTILYLIDGRSVLLDFFGITDVAALPVALSDLERIEVVLGPASTLYGANAFAGVINLVTKKPTKEGYRLAARGQGGLAFGGPGAPGSRLERGRALGGGFAEYTQAFGKVGVRLSAGGEYLPNASTSPRLLGVASDAPHRRVSANADVLADARGWKLRAQVAAALKAGTWATFERARIDIQDLALTLGAEKTNLAANGDALTLTWWGRRMRGSYALVFDPFPPVAFSLEQWSTELLAQYASPRFLKQRVIVGLQARAFHIGWDLIRPEGRLQHFYGLYLEDEIRPLEPLILTAGVRVETREAPAFRPFQRLTVSPRLAAVFVPNDNHSVRLEFANAFRNPTPFESFADVTAFDGAVALMAPNPRVRAEIRDQLSFSYQGRLGWLRPRLEAFYALQRNAVGLGAASADSLLPQRFHNPGGVGDLDRYVGGSIKLEATPIPEFSAFLIYTYLDVRHLGRAMVNAPSDRVGAGFVLTLAGFSGSVQAYYHGESLGNVPLAPDVHLLSGRIILNARLAYSFGKVAFGEVEAYVAGTNLIDARLGPGAPRDLGIVQSERVGPRVWAGLAWSYF